MRMLCGIILAAALPFEVLAQGTPDGSSEKERIGRVCDGEFGSFNARFMGAQTWSWKPAKTEGDEILFMPKNAPWGKEVHGGIPICWPWFGAPPKDGLPKHGLARYATWRFKERDWKTGVLFELDSNDETRRIWPHDFHLEVQLKMEGDDSLLVRLTETNTGKEPFESAWGFHPYFRVTDAERVAVDGEVQPTPSVRVQSSATEKGRRRTLTDLVSGRMISVECTDNEDWFVWNPGVDRTPLCETLGPDEWKRFYCLEPLTEKPQPLAPGESCAHEMIIKVCSVDEMAATAANGVDLQHDGWIDFNKNGVKDVYEDSSASVEARVADLLSQMTLEEKTCQLATLYGSGRVLKDAQPTAGWKNEVWKDGIGNIDEELNGVGKMFKEHPEYMTPYSNHVAAINAIQRWFVEETRLGIPVDFSNEGIHGLNHTGATPLPAPIAIGSTWNRALVRRAGEIVGEEARLIGYSNVYAPILDVARDQRWGRTLECYGEDPFLVAELGKEMALGIQSQGVASTLKHYAAYGVPKGGRDGDCRTDPHITPRELHEIFLSPFKRVIREAKPMGVMCSYNDWNGEPVAASKWFLTDLLRGEYGFDGYVVSDSEAVEFVHTKHAVAETYEEACAQVLEAGLNVRTHFTPPEDFILPVRAAVRSGRLAMSVIDKRVAEVLAVKFRLGLFDNPYLGDAANADVQAGAEKHRDFADAIQAESFVLLKNDGVLPLAKGKHRKILVTGPLADETNFMVSRYGPNGFDPKPIRNAIADYLGTDAEVRFVRGCTTADATWPESEIYTTPLSKDEADGIDAAVAAAKESDIVIAVVGEDAFATGESRSRTSLDLPGRQRLLVERLFETGRPVVVVLVNGQPLTVAWMDCRANAILETWFAGPFGGAAVAKALFGEINPSGKTTVTFPKSIGQVEYNFPFKKGSHGGQPKFGPNGFGYTRVTGALYPFGHGLSYTTFGYANLAVSPMEGGTDALWEVSCDVTNTGKVLGSEVVQLYVRDLYSSVVTYDSVLRGFEKVHLKPGETRRVTFALRPEDLMILDRNMRWTVEPGEFEIMVGASSEDVRLKKTINVLHKEAR